MNTHVNRYLVFSNENSMSIETAQLFPRVGVGSSNVTTAVSPTAQDAGQAVGSLHPSLPHYAPTELSAQSTAAE